MRGSLGDDGSSSSVYSKRRLQVIFPVFGSFYSGLSRTKHFSPRYGYRSALVTLLLGFPLCLSAAGDPPADPYLSLKFDGWIEGGSYLNLYGQQGEFNFGPTDSNSAQVVNLDQFYLSSMIQYHFDDGLDLGFTLDNLVGTDWNASYSYGFLDGAFRWNEIGWDLPQVFLTLRANESLQPNSELNVGKMFTPYGFEDVRARERPLYSTGYLYNFIYPTTQTGISYEWELTDGISLYQALTNAPDISAAYLLRPTYLAGASYQDNSDRPTNLAIYVSYGEGLMRMATIMQSGVPFVPKDLDSFSNPELGRVLIVSESLEQTLSEHVTLNLDLTQGCVSHSKTLYAHQPGTSGAWLGGGLWLKHEQLAQDLTGVVRFEVLYNSHGVATGYDGTFLETTIGIAYNPMAYLTFRPELRYDRAFGSSPYVSATSQQQFSMNIDGILSY
ncbi:MAG: hypothetical protein RL333_2180 [Pseudomonadota bacterium]